MKYLPFFIVVFFLPFAAFASVATSSYSRTPSLSSYCNNATTTYTVTLSSTAPPMDGYEFLWYTSAGLATSSRWELTGASAGAGSPRTVSDVVRFDSANAKAWVASTTYPFTVYAVDVYVHDNDGDHYNIGLESGNGSGLFTVTDCSGGGSVGTTTAFDEIFGSATSSASSSQTVSLVDNPTQDFFMGMVLFLGTMFGILYLFKLGT